MCWKVLWDAGEGLIKFIQKGRGNAILIGILFLIGPINLIMGSANYLRIIQTKER